MDIKQHDEILALIARNLADTADSEDIARLKEWIEDSSLNRQYFEQVRIIWDASGREWNPDKIDVKAGLQNVLEKINKTSPKRSIWNYWQKVAAVLFIPFVIGSSVWVYMFSNRITSNDEPVYYEVYAAFGTRSAIKLADSTLVWLNSGSSLRYPDKFNTKNRQVYLKGEGYFEVKSDISRPFLVQTSTIMVKATGTKFSVIDYNSSPAKEVTLVTGKVSVNKLEGESSTLIAELNPDQHLHFDGQTQTKSIRNEDVYKYIAWKDGKLIFRNEPLSEVVQKIGLMYNVDIELRGEKLKEYRYRATFRDESLEEILRLLKLSSPIDYREIKREPLPDGTFPQKRVILFEKNHPINHQ